MNALGYQVPRDPTAVVGRRTAAFLVDNVIILVPPALMVSAELEYLEENEQGQIEVTGGALDPDEFCDQYLEEIGDTCVPAADRVYFTDDLSLAPWLTAFGLAVLLLVVLQGLRGVTPGKALFGIRTVGEHGRPPGIGRAAGRWLMWIVDGAPWCLPLVGLITALSSTGHRRVGDMAAKTLVVRKEDAGHPIAVPGLDTTASIRPGEPVGVGPSGYPPPPAESTPDASAPSDAPSAPPTAGTAYPPPGGGTAYPPPGGGADQPSAPASGTDQPSAPGDRTDQPSEQVESDRSGTEVPGAAEPGGEPGADAGWYRPQWDPARGTYIVWDPRRGQWLGWDLQRQEWRPL